MDPNLFHIDWERTLEALMGIIVLAFVVERVCALIFESRWYIRLFEDPRVCDHQGDPDLSKMPGKLYPLKEMIAFGIAALICLKWDFDAISIVLLNETTLLSGKLLTAAVIAGGSKAAIKLFQDLMKVRSTAEIERKKLKEG